MDTATYLEQSQKENFRQPSRKKNSIVTLTGITGYKTFNMSSCGFYFKTF